MMDIQFPNRDIGPRSKVWAEKDVIEKAAYEFAEVSFWFIIIFQSR